MRRTLITVALLVWAVAWGRLLLNTATTPSPAREVRFLDADGRPAERAHCHGSAWVLDGVPWMVCTVDAQGKATDYLTRYDLSAGTARYVRELGDMAWRGISAAVRPPEGGLIFVDGDGAVRRWTADGAWLDLELGGFKRRPCLAWREGALEAVYWSAGGVVVARRVDGAWTRRSARAPTPVAGWTQRFEACEDTATGWRLIWLRHPERASAGPVPVEVWSQVGIEGAPGLEATLALDPEDPRAHLRLFEGRVMLEPAVLARAGGVHRWTGSPPLERGDDGAWRRPALPPEARAEAAGHDYIFGGPRAGAVMRFDMGRVFARVGGAWFTVTDDRAWRLVELSADLSAPARVGPAAVNRFWLPIGFKMLPDGADGYWLLGGLGEAYIHVDAQLARTDEHGFVGRVGRLLQQDRSKRNSDFYLTGAWLKKLGFGWVLLALPLLLGALRRRRSLAAGIYLVGAAAGGWWFWQMSGVFW